MDAPSNKRAFHVAFVDKELTLIENGVNYFAPWSTVWIACGGFCPEFLFGEAIGMCDTLTDEMPRPPRPPPRLWPSLYLNRAEVGIIYLDEQEDTETELESPVCSGMDLDVCSDTEAELEPKDCIEIDSSQSDVHCPDTLLDETQPGSPTSSAFNSTVRSSFGFDRIRAQSCPSHSRHVRGLAAIGMSSSSQQLVKQYQIAKNLGKLRGLAEHSLEMQQLLIQTAESYLVDKRKIEPSGSSLHQQSQAKRRRSRTESADTIEDPNNLPAVLVLPEGIVLRRGLHVFSAWGQRICAELLVYIEDSLRGKVEHMPKSTLHELMEMSLDLRLFGQTLDRIGNNNKEALFESLLATYRALGSRLRNVPIVNGVIDWKLHGHFTLDTSLGPASIMLHCKLLDQTITIPEDVLKNDPLAWCDIAVENNFSRYSAQIQTLRDVYKCSMLFPRLCRTLLRRTSDVLGAAGVAVSASEAAMEMDLAGVLGEVEEPASPSPTQAVVE